MAVASVTIGAPAPRDLAAFYARLLGWPVTASEPARPGIPPEDGWAQLRSPDGEDGPTLNFEYEAKFTRPVWPAADGRQNATQHLDIAVADLEEAVRWAPVRSSPTSSRRRLSGSCSTRPGIRSACSAANSGRAGEPWGSSRPEPAAKRITQMLLTLWMAPLRYGKGRQNGANPLPNGPRRAPLSRRRALLDRLIQPACG
jgi:hypothetical protein